MSGKKRGARPDTGMLIHWEPANRRRKPNGVVCGVALDQYGLPASMMVTLTGRVSVLAKSDCRAGAYDG